MKPDEKSYEQELRDILNNDSRVRGTLLSYRAELQYEVEGGEVFDVFDMQLDDGRLCLFSYGDEDNVRMGSLKTVLKYVKLCSIGSVL